ncbi:MAG: hypothetical protein WA949_18845 [Phormidesmis sp.]
MRLPTLILRSLTSTNYLSSTFSQQQCLSATAAKSILSKPKSGSVNLAQPPIESDGI